MKMRMVIEIGADGIVRVVESQPIAGDGDPQPASVTAQAETQAIADSSYGETVKLDRNSPEFKSRKDELKKLGYKWDRKEKVWRKPTEANGSQTSAPVTAQAEPEAVADSSYGEIVKLDHNSPEFKSRKDELKKLGYKWDHKEKAWRKPTAANGSRKSERLPLRRVFQILAFAMMVGMS